MFHAIADQLRLTGTSIDHRDLRTELVNLLSGGKPAHRKWYTHEGVDRIPRLGKLSFKYENGPCLR